MGALNLLALEAHLVERLTQALAQQRPAVHVLCAADLAGVAEEKQLVPAVHLVYQGYRVPENRSDGLRARLVQTWLAVATVRNARGLKSGDAARTDCGQLAAQVAAALMGWRAPGIAGPLKLVAGPAAQFGAGFMYLPLAFEVELVL